MNRDLFNQCGDTYVNWICEEESRPGNRVKVDWPVFQDRFKFTPLWPARVTVTSVPVTLDVPFDAERCSIINDRMNPQQCLALQLSSFMPVAHHHHIRHFFSFFFFHRIPCFEFFFNCVTVRFEQTTYYDFDFWLLTAESAFRSM